MVEILAAQFAMQDMADGEEREDEERHDDAEEWIGVNMAGASLGSNGLAIGMEQTVTVPAGKQEFWREKRCLIGSTTNLTY